MARTDKNRREPAPFEKALVAIPSAEAGENGKTEDNPSTTTWTATWTNTKWTNTLDGYPADRWAHGTEGKNHETTPLLRNGNETIQTRLTDYGFEPLVARVRPVHVDTTWARGKGRANS